jgi:hypothetical protein
LDGKERVERKVTERGIATVSSDEELLTKKCKRSEQKGRIPKAGEEVCGRKRWRGSREEK